MLPRIEASQFSSSTLFKRFFHTACDVPVGGGDRARRLRHDDGLPAVGGFAKRKLERDLAEEGHADARRLSSRAAMAENIVTRSAVRANEHAHILDDAENWRVDLAEHLDAATRIDEREVLGRRDDH